MDKTEAKKIADLARLEVADDELEKIAKEMSSILEYVDKIKSADIPEDSDGEERIESAGTRNIMAEDENPHESGINTKRLVDEMPEKDGDFTKVKKIL